MIGRENKIARPYRFDRLSRTVCEKNRRSGGEADLIFKIGIVQIGERVVGNRDSAVNALSLKLPCSELKGSSESV